ncbi:MAG: RNA polymerase sigma factor, partial [Planctomycetes bacterium]|nr:RNA polymerase sigma factor [Planctomycetota bacterium]
TNDYHLAEDLCQETLFRAFNALGTLESPDRIQSWLYSIAYHVSVDWIRTYSTRKRSPRAPDPADTRANIVSGTDELLIEREERVHQTRQVNKLWGKVRELPPIYKEIFELRYRRWRPIAHIAREIGLPEGNVKVRLFRARRLLMKILEKRANIGYSVNGATTRPHHIPRSLHGAQSKDPCGG